MHGLFTLLALPSWAFATPLATGQVDFGPPVGPTAVSVESVGSAVRLSAGSRTLALGAPPSGTLTATVAEVRLAGGKNLAHVVVTGSGPFAREALVGQRARGELSVLWMGDTGLRGDIGERSGTTLTLDDWNDDALPDPIVAVVSERARLCGADRALLEPTGLDPATRTFARVDLNRHRGRTAADVAGAWESPGPTGSPLLDVATWTSTSAVRVDGAVIDVPAPSSVGDSDAATTWWFARRQGEFVTAEITVPVAIRALSILPAVAAASGRAGTPARTRTLLVATEEGLFRATIPDDPGARPNQPIWISLPAPQRTRCLSVSLGDTFPGRGASATETGISEIAVYTELDWGEGIEAMVAELGSDEHSGDAIRVLSQLGPRALPALTPTVTSDSPVVRRRAAQVLGQWRDAAAAPSLLRLAGDPDREVADEALAALAALGDGARTPVADAMRGEPGPVRAGAAGVLGRWADAAALAVLVPEAGRGGAAERRAIRDALRSCARALQGAALGPIRARLAERPAVEAVADLVRSVDLASSDGAGLALEALPGLLAASDFPVRWHAVRIAGDLCARAADDVRGRLGPVQRDDDEILRAEAATSLGRCPGDAPGIEQALSDRSPRVRRAAAEAFVGRSALPTRQLRKLFATDRWPMVRAAAVVALAGVPRSLSDEELIAGLGDGSLVVRRATVGAIAMAKRRRLWQALVDRMEDAREDALVRADAAAAIGSVCALQAAEPLAERVRRALQPMSDPDQRVGAAAIGSLVRLGGQPREEAQRLAAIESTPGYLKAAVRVAQEEPACR